MYFFRYDHNEFLIFSLCEKRKKNVICLFLEKNSKISVFEKKVKLDLTLFGKNKKCHLSRFGIKCDLKQCLKHILQVSMAGFEPCQKENVAAAQCWIRPQSATRPGPPPWHQTGVTTCTVLRNPVLRNRGCHVFFFC